MKYRDCAANVFFKQLASGDFGDENIYNWSYADEQEAKANWDYSKGSNPYENLPSVELRTYQMSKMIGEKAARGAIINDDGNETAYAFDLNEFFATDGAANFIYKDEVQKFLDSLKTNEKYPFAPEARNELNHTLWILNRVDSVYALLNMLRRDDFFKDYKVIAAVGDGRAYDVDENTDEQAVTSNYKKVVNAIAHNDKTITLSVGQLTVGVTIPEWSGVLMLANMKSPAAYIQTAFRAQNPCKLKRIVIDPQTGKKKTQLYRKETAYIFDFDPARTLDIYEQFADNLTPITAGGAMSDDDRKANIRRMLNFLPVIGEDEDGKMITLDAEKVLTIPRKLKSIETMRRGFMCNYLFRDLDRIFGNQGVMDILNKIEPQKQSDKRIAAVDEKQLLDDAANTKTDDEGNVEPDEKVVIGTAQGIFGKKYYDDAYDAVSDGIDDMRHAADNAKIIDSVNRAFDEAGDGDKYSLTPGKVSDAVLKSTHECSEAIVAKVDDIAGKLVDTVIDSVSAKHGLKASEKKTIERLVRNEFDKKTRPARDDFETSVAVDTTRATSDITDAALSGNMDEIEKIGAIKQSLCESQQEHSDTLIDSINETMNKLCDEIPTLISASLEKRAAEQTRRNAEELLRGHLRGFARTIPSFLMAYGDDGFTLETMDSYVDDDVFIELTGINKDMFRFLRDGGTYEFVDKNGEKQVSTLDRGVIDPFVFDGACREFMRKKAEIGNPIMSDSNEDIFDYIPPQKTNQIYTPKNVVNMQLDLLEKEEPGCFDNPNNTFADLHTKSGYYLVMIAKRLYNSDAIKTIYPDDNVRLRHILTKQVFGIAPSKITSLIAGNYLYSCMPNSDIMNIEHRNLIYADTLTAVENGTMQQLINEKFGYLAEEGTDVKFNAIVGNPPYQINDGGGTGSSAKPAYQMFSNAAKNLSNIHCLIQPARWMTGGKGLDEYRYSMMNDTHIKAIDDFADSKSVFQNVDIKGGISIYVYDNNYDGACSYTRHSYGNVNTTKRKLVENGCDIIIRDNTLVSIYHNVCDDNIAGHVSDITSARKPYGLAADVIGHEAKYNLPKISDTEIKNGYSLLGLDSATHKRVIKYIGNNYPLPKNGYVDKYKLFVSKAYGCGAISDVPASPVLALPGQICTETFIEMGPFDTKDELNHFYQYFKTKFFRAIVGIKKQTQNTSSSTYSLVPLQDFTSSSDIDWSQSVSDIDKQLYKKYNLTDDEIDFIETHVKPMA